MLNLNFFCCPNCAKKNIKNTLRKKGKYIACNKCKDLFPVYKNYPVFFTNDNDFLHLRKALLPTKYRVCL